MATPSARYQLVIELLNAIQSNSMKPVDAVISQKVREWRFLGSKDRVAIIDLIYALLRHQAQLDWWLSFCTNPPTPRGRLLVWLRLCNNFDVSAIQALASGQRYGLASLTQDEKDLLEVLTTYQNLDHEGQPSWVLYNYPSWLQPLFEEQYGDNLIEEASAWMMPSHIDIRVNTLKTDRQIVQQRLMAEDKVESYPTPYSPWGLRLAKRYPLTVTQSYKEGWFDIQEEGSQLIALLCDTQPGQWVIDYCAGAGGKTLALAAIMQNKGRIVTCDISKKRLAAGVKRFRRAGIHNYQHHVLPIEGKDRWLKRHQGKFDRVLVDAPCSGTGTWRRNPDMKWRFQPNDLTELNHKQTNILQQAAQLVRPQGLLIYATCSLLPQENERIVEHFLRVDSTFSLVPLSQQWQKILRTNPPCADPFLYLTPHQHKTDGFFVALLEKVAVPS